MKQAPDMTHPLTDEFAAYMSIELPDALRPEGAGRRQPWLSEPAWVRDWFRARARQFIAGDDSVAPWRFIPASPISVRLDSYHHRYQARYYWPWVGPPDYSRGRW